MGWGSGIVEQRSRRVTDRFTIGSVPRRPEDVGRFWRTARLAVQVGWVCLVGVTLVSSNVLTLNAADWPTYRMDSARSGYTSEPLPNQMRLRWVFRASHGPAPAWPSSERMQFDVVFEPIIVGKSIIFGSSADDKVYALDSRTGVVQWTFCSDGPIRFAPAAWHDRLFVASDDGWLYALALTDGHLLWKHSTGPNSRKMIGNNRMISHWPARGGPVVLDDTVYYAAGIWPSDGVAIAALDAKTGKPVWINTTAGGIEMPQPHGGAVAKSGIAPQGYCVADARRLFVPTGRAVPAAFDRADGRFLYYHLQVNQQRGGSFATIVGSFLYNDGCLFDPETGLLSTRIGLGTLAVTPKGVVRAEGASLAEYRWVDLQRRDRKGKLVKTRALQNDRLISCRKDVLALIVTGSDAVCGEDGSVCAIDYSRQRNRWWSHDVEGRALALAYADGKLVVSTDRGVIYCFADDPRTAGSPIESADVDSVATESVPSEWSRAAVAILEKTKGSAGYCVDWGCGKGQLALELARRSKFRIIAVDSDPENIAAARNLLDKAGVYGSRVSVHLADLEQADYPSRFANLVVSARSLTAPLTAESERQVTRMRRPFGGRTCIGPYNQLRMTIGESLEGTGSWTHQNASAANTICSDDRQLHGPLEMFWFGDVDFRVPNRHGQGPAPLYHRGYLVVGGVDGVCAVDAFNGRTLWVYQLDGNLRDYDGIHHDVGVGETGGNYCLSHDSLFVRHGETCFRVDLATGKEVARYKTPVRDGAKNREWGFLAVSDGRLFGTVANESHTVSARYRWSRAFTESVLFFAIDLKTGRVCWTYQPKHSIRHNAIAIGGGTVFLVDRPLAMKDRITSPRRDGKQGPRMKPGQQPGGVVCALDASDGRIRWKQSKDVFATQLGLSIKHHVLLMNYAAVRHNFFRLPSEVGGRLAALDSRTGKRLWDHAADYRTRPIIQGRSVVAEGGAWDLVSGDPLPFDFHRSYGCGQIAASGKMLVFRSATIGYWDLLRDVGVENFGGVRPGCWITAIPAGGMVLAPNGSAHCRCSYQTQAWMALCPSAPNKKEAVQPPIDATNREKALE